jgi:AAA+ ATPase superfamily predicted ATPase
LKPGWLTEALNIDAKTALEHYAIFGGIPRYWELAADYPNLEGAVKDLILDRKGVLHDEPMRLLLDDLKSAVQPYSILTLLGQGCRKISEIASRLEIPVSSMSRPLALLQDLGYIQKEIPFGENTTKSKRSLYSIKDNFINFYFNFVNANKSLLEIDLVEKVWGRISDRLNLFYSNVWEDLARQSVPFLNIENIEWNSARRWWGKGIDGNDLEVDVMAESLDGKYILVGEVKWSDSVKVDEVLSKLKYCVSNIPNIEKKKTIYALWLKNKMASVANIITPNEVFAVLK